MIIGFTLISDEGAIAYFLFSDQGFLLQDFYEEDYANNFMMHLLVKDVDSWYQHVLSSGITDEYHAPILE